MALPDDPGTLVGAARDGSTRAVGRLVSIIERGGTAAAAVAAALTGLARSGTVIGLTGPPGVGKSTTVARLIAGYRERGRRVAVLAVDPSSPFSGGALLGDRVRMAAHATDPQVYIRSMSSRGQLGGLSAAAPAAVDLLSALGFDPVLVETVGVGQNEVDVMRLADTVAVVLAPGMGDGVQAAKAGILEVADLLVVNKADREGAEVTVRELRGMVALGRAGTAEPGQWRVPVLSLVATDGTGMTQLFDEIDAHAEHLVASGEVEERRRRRAGSAVRAALLETVDRALSSREGVGVVQRAADRVADGLSDHRREAAEVAAWLGARLE